jgi:predicted transcriptional regulator
VNPLPALKDAAYDRHLRDTAKALYLLLVYELDLQAYREVKQEVWANALGCDRTTVTKALGQLVGAGYVERLEVPGNVAQHYRLVYRREPLIARPTAVAS